MEQRTVGGDGRLLVRVRSASYAVPGGFPIVVSHFGTCENQARDEELVRCVRGAKPVVMNELAAAAKAAMMVMGCSDRCRIDKDNSAGVLYTEHSQDSLFAASSGTTAFTTGTGSLVGERLIEGRQGTPSEDNALAIGCVSQFSSSWPSGISNLGSSEKPLYKGMRLDRSSDEDYVPSTVVVDDVAMTLDGGKTTEKNGLGDSRHASSGSGDKADTLLPSSVPYSVSATQDILGAFADFEAGVLPARPAELESTAGSEVDDVEMEGHSAQVVDPVVMSDADRLTRLEKGLEGDRDLFDAMRDVVEGLEEEVANLKNWKQDISNNGCPLCRPARASARAAIPLSKKPTVACVAPPKATTSVPQGSTVPSMPAPSGRPGPSTAACKPVEQIQVKVSPAPVVSILRRPTYATSDEARVTASFASVASKGASADGYKVVANRKRFVKKPAVSSQEPITSIPVRKRHFTVKFDRARDTKFVLPKDVTVGKIRDVLNTALFTLSSGAYFSVAVLGKWGDVLLTLASTEVDAIVGYYPAMREALETLGLDKFSFARDTEKVKVFVGQVPLSRFGGGWQPSEWEGREAFDHLATDIEHSNPGVVVAARPSWAGRLHKLKERKVGNAGLILVLELTQEVRRIMAGSQPKIVVAGRYRFCRMWREDNPTIVCSRCQTVGHYAGECKASAVCAFCHKNHLTTAHVCPVISCAKNGSVCEHMQRICLLCRSVDHFTGHRECDALRGASSSPPNLGPATPVTADHTSVVGVSDISRGRLRRQRAGRPGTPLAPHMIEKGVSAAGITCEMQRSEINPDRSIHGREVVVPRLDKGKGVARSPSAPADVSRVGGNGGACPW